MGTRHRKQARAASARLAALSVLIPELLIALFSGPIWMSLFAAMKLTKAGVARL